MRPAAATVPTSIGAPVLVLGGFPRGIHVVVLAGLKSPLAGQMRIALADVVERARQQDRSEAAEHHRRQHVSEHVALRLAENFRITDGERDRAFADTAGHDGDHYKEERVIGAKPKQRANQRADDAGDDRANRRAARIS